MSVRAEKPRRLMLLPICPPSAAPSVMPGTLRSASDNEFAPCASSSARSTCTTVCGISRDSVGILAPTLEGPVAYSPLSGVPITWIASSVCVAARSYPSVDSFVVAALPLAPEFAAVDPVAPASAIVEPASAKPGNGTLKAMHKAEHSGLSFDRRTSMRSSSNSAKHFSRRNTSTNDNYSHLRRQGGRSNRGDQSNQSCQYATSIHRPNFRPTWRKCATCRKPSFSCSATEAGFGSAAPPITQCTSNARSASSSAPYNAEPKPHPTCPGAR